MQNIFIFHLFLILDFLSNTAQSPAKMFSFHSKMQRSASVQRLARWSWNSNSQNPHYVCTKWHSFLFLVCSSFAVEVVVWANRFATKCSVTSLQCVLDNTHTHTHMQSKSLCGINIQYIPSCYYSPGSHHVWPHTSIIISALCVFSTSGAGILICP